MEQIGFVNSNKNFYGNWKTIVNIALEKENKVISPTKKYFQIITLNSKTRGPMVKAC